jgi:ubiquinone/menaquinone biosynthesis C-methylase UbiE
MNQPSNATGTGALQDRITQNIAGGEADLNVWIFDHLNFRDGEQVLELCCGTGKQTDFFLKNLDSTSKLTAFDISRTSLDAIKGRHPSDARLNLVEGNITDISTGLGAKGGEDYSMIFCAYGLYYSADPVKTMDDCLARLNKEGRMVVVGPFGPNNEELFTDCRNAGVKIEQPVTYSSQEFMPECVVSHLGSKFHELQVSTLRNTVTWKTPEAVMSYWKASTFYVPAAEPRFTEIVNERFATEGVYRNTKWIMMAQAYGKR